MENIEKQKLHLIISPHCDDEIIGCYEVIQREKNVIILYSEDAEEGRRQEALTLRLHCSNIKDQIFQNSIPSVFLSKKENTIFYYPDPIHENHPLHRSLGMVGETMFRSGFDIIFYSTLMNVPWMHEVKPRKTKEAILNEVYCSQKSLWKYEKKFILFEARHKWLF